MYWEAHQFDGDDKDYTTAAERVQNNAHQPGYGVEDEECLVCAAGGFDMQSGQEEIIRRDEQLEVLST